jgi:hypothetical protein
VELVYDLDVPIARPSIMIDYLTDTGVSSEIAFGATMGFHTGVEYPLLRACSTLAALTAAGKQIHLNNIRLLQQSCISLRAHAGSACTAGVGAVYVNIVRERIENVGYFPESGANKNGLVALN